MLLFQFFTLNHALNKIFLDEDFGFRMRFEQALAPKFFGDTSEHAEIIKQRQRYLTCAPEHCVAARPGLRQLLDEAIEFAASVADVQNCETRDSDENALMSLGRKWEPDFLLLKKAHNQPPHLVGGCVCFPSSWSLAEKIGRPIQEIHDAVPGLNPAIGLPIEKFLTKLPPGTAWLRFNWGLSRSAELNQHPARKLPPLDESITPSDVWLRIENQALLLLPQSGGILFGIRINNYPFDAITKDPTLSPLVARALRTMPEDVAVYKRIAAARDRLLRILIA